MVISDLIKALQAGEELKNATEWKNQQATTGAVSAILFAALSVAGFIGIHPIVNTDQVIALAGGIAALLGVYNSYATVATSKRIGLQTGDTSPPPSNPITNPPAGN